MQSGFPAPLKLIDDFRNAYDDGLEKVKTYLEERIKSSTKLITDTISRNKRFSFSKLPSSVSDTESAKQQKTLQMENKAMISILNLAQEAKINLECLMNFRLTDMPLALCNVNGPMRKIVKSKIIEHFCLKDAATNLVDDSRMIVDMGYIWRLGTPRKEDREKLDRTPFTWADYAVKLFEMIINCHTHAKEFYIVNDRYDINESIKDAEHLRRAQSESFSKNAYPKNSALFPPANQARSFFTNPANKMRLQRYL